MKGPQPQLRLESNFLDFIEGEYQKKFFSTCFETFKILRKNKNLLINFVYLMKNSEIGEAHTGDISNAYKHVGEKLFITLSDNESIHRLHGEIVYGFSSYAQKFADWIHTGKIKGYF